MKTAHFVSFYFAKYSKPGRLRIGLDQFFVNQSDRAGALPHLALMRVPAALSVYSYLELYGKLELLSPSTTYPLLQ